MRLRALLALCISPGVTFAADAVLTGNIGVTSNYIWRGETQTDDEAAVFGGLEYQSRSGPYAGLWTAPVRGEQGYEVDLYAGYRLDRHWDIGLIRYMYPGQDDPAEALDERVPIGDFTEVRVGFWPGRHEVAWYYSPDYRATGEDQHYLEFNLRYPFGPSTVEVHVGAKQGESVDDTENRVGDYRLSLIRGPFTFSITEMTDNEDGRQSDNPRLAATWRHEIDLF